MHDSPEQPNSMGLKLDEYFYVRGNPRVTTFDAVQRKSDYHDRYQYSQDFTETTLHHFGVMHFGQG